LKAFSKSFGSSDAPTCFAISTKRLWRSLSVSLGLRSDLDDMFGLYAYGSEPRKVEFITGGGGLLGDYRFVALKEGHSLSLWLLSTEGKTATIQIQDAAQRVLFQQTRDAKEAPKWGQRFRFRVSHLVAFLRSLGTFRREPWRVEK
jgi:hypothetical protein